MITVLVILLVVLALVGAPMFAVMAAFALIGATSLPTNEAPNLVRAFGAQLAKVQGLFTGDAGSTLATIPLFTFVGYLLAESKAAERLVNCAKAWLGWMPGGLAIITVFICALFTTFSGASGVTIVAVGGLLYPALVKEGYTERFSLGLVTGTGSIGLLFPPSLPLIIYAVVYTITAQAMTSGGGEAMALTSFRFERFLLAGIVPGLVLCGSVGLYCVYRAVRDKIPTTKFDLREALRLTPKAIPELLLPVVMILALAKGIAPEEAAALGTLYVLVLEMFVFRDLKLTDLPRIARESMRLVGAIFLVILAATALSDYFVNGRIPDKLFAWMDAHIHEKWTFLLALNVFLLVVGSVMDIFSALLVVVPLIATAAVHYQIDPYHMGVIFLLNLEIGYVHPPVGLNLFISSFRFRKPMTELYWAIIPYLVLMVISLLLVTYVPALSPIKAEKAGGGAEEVTPEQPAPGTTPGAASKITLPDGTVLTPDSCETEEMKANPLDQADCRAKFILWAKCDTLEDELDKMDCRDKVIEGEDPFEGGDAGAADEDQEEEAGADAASAEGADGGP